MRLFSLFIIAIIVSCTSPSQSDKKQSLEDESDWVTREYKKQLKQTGQKDSIEIFGLPMKELPEDFFDNSEIKHLRIGCTQFDCMNSLSPKIAQLVNLETLILSKTSLKKLPKEIGQLKKLKTLKVQGGGQLEYLPKEIGQLENLELLDVWRNKLHEIPKTLYNLKELKTLYIGQNKFTKTQIKQLETNLPDTEIEIYR